MTKRNLFLKDKATDEKHSIGCFDSNQAVASFLEKLYTIVSVNEQQELLMINQFNETGTEVTTRHFIGCFENKDAIQAFLTDAHEFEEVPEEI